MVPPRMSFDILILLLLGSLAPSATSVEFRVLDIQDFFSLFEYLSVSGKSSFMLSQTALSLEPKTYTCFTDIACETTYRMLSIVNQQQVRVECDNDEVDGACVLDAEDVGTHALLAGCDIEFRVVTFANGKSPTSEAATKPIMSSLFMLADTEATFSMCSFTLNTASVPTDPMIIIGLNEYDRSPVHFYATYFNNPETNFEIVSQTKEGVVTSEGCPVGYFGATSSDTPINIKATNVANGVVPQPIDLLSYPPSICSTCPDNTFSNKTGSSSCTSCPADEPPSPSATFCGTCPPGFGTNSDGTKCMPCIPGTFSFTSDFKACTWCPPGTSNPDYMSTDESACIKCAHGKAQSAPGYSTCFDCIKPPINAEIGQTRCREFRVDTYLEILDAIGRPWAHAHVGDEVFVAPKTYKCNVTQTNGWTLNQINHYGDSTGLTPPCYNSQLMFGIVHGGTMRCEESRICVLDGNYETIIFNILGSSFKVVGIHFTNGKGLYAGAMQVTGNSPVEISHCKFTNNLGFIVGAIWVGSGTTLISESTFASNYVVYTNQTRIRIMDVFIDIPGNVRLAEPTKKAPVFSLNYTAIEVEVLGDQKPGTVLKGCPPGHFGKFNFEPNSCSAGGNNFAVSRKNENWPSESSCGGRHCCQPCPDGQFSLGATSLCVNCLPGKYPDETKSFCLPCAAGSHSLGGKKECELCAKQGEGLYSDKGSSVCTRAPFGHQPVADRSDIEECEPGSYSNGLGMCEQCPVNEFSNKSGVSACTPCELNEHTGGKKGQTECSCKPSFVEHEGVCTCEPGKYFKGGVCDECEEGFFKTSHGGEGVSCEVCDDAIKNSFYTEKPAISKESCQCSKGDYRVLEKPKPEEGHVGKCVKCDNEKMICDKDQGERIENVTLKDGYWRFSNQAEGDDIEECPSVDACVSSSGTGDELCAEGSSGPVCDICDNGFTKDIMGTCVSCSSSGATAATALATLSFFILIAIVVCIAVKRRLKKKATALGTTKSRFLSDTITKASIDREYWIYRLRTKAKILAGCYQIVADFQTNLDVKFPPMFQTFCKLLSQIFNLKFLSFSSLGCILDADFHYKLLCTTLIPLAVVILIYAYFLIRYKLWNDPELDTHLTSCFTIFLTLTYAVFIMVSTVIFQTFQCDTYSDEGVRWLKADKTIDCDNPLHHKYQTYAIFMIFVYPVGITALYGILLWRSREYIQRADRMENLTIRPIAFLWEAYEPEYWWFEVYECVRRLSLTYVLVVVMPGSISQIIIAILISLLSIAVYMETCPYIKDSDDTLANVTMWAIFFTLFAALLRRTWLESESEGLSDNAMGALLLMVNLSSISLVVMQLFVKPIKKMFRILERKHLHNGTIRGITEEHDTKEGFTTYFTKLAESTPETAGWELITPKEWGPTSVKAAEFLDETGAVGEWRCSTGDGPVNQCRVKFTIDVSYEATKEHLVNPWDEEDENDEMTLEKTVFGRSADGTESIKYRAAKLPWPFYARDFCFQEYIHDGKDQFTMCSRSCDGEDYFPLKRSTSLKRVRGFIEVAGYLLTRVGPDHTQVVVVYDVDLSILIGVDYVNRKSGSKKLKSNVLDFRKYADERRGRDTEDDNPRLSMKARAKKTAKTVKRNVGKRATKVGKRVSEMGMGLKNTIEMIPYPHLHHRHTEDGDPSDIMDMGSIYGGNAGGSFGEDENFEGAENPIARKGRPKGGG